MVRAIKSLRKRCGVPWPVEVFKTRFQKCLVCKHTIHKEYIEIDGNCTELTHFGSARVDRTGPFWDALGLLSKGAPKAP